MGIEIRGMVPLLQVFDITTSIAFYRDVLGLRGRDHFQAWSRELRLGPAPAEWHGVDAKHGLRRRLSAART
jgi:catechol 2,3-dioxygenase-like lactoylglutathione lyase family enzyme